MASKIHKSTFDFLKNLKKNNNRDWFNENKEKYIEANQNVLDFVTELLEKMGSFDESILKLDPKKTLFRIYRDTRFSKDKSPYKTNFGASINGIGKKDGGAGYYLHISPNECFLAAGVYMCDPKQLKKIRQEISGNAEEFNEIIKDKNFKNFEFNQEKLVRVPQGFDKEDPMAEFLKMKHMVVSINLKDEYLMKDEAVNNCSNEFKKMSKLVNFLNETMN